VIGRSIQKPATPAANFLFGGGAGRASITASNIVPPVSALRRCFFLIVLATLLLATASYAQDTNTIPIASGIIAPPQVVEKLNAWFAVAGLALLFIARELAAVARWITGDLIPFLNTIGEAGGVFGILKNFLCGKPTTKNTP
jgi:hypothetical protein